MKCVDIFLTLVFGSIAPQTPATAKGQGANAVHMVNVWSTELGMCVGQQKVADKSNESVPWALKLTG